MKNVSSVYDDPGFKRGALDRVWVNHTSGFECQQKIAAMGENIVNQLAAALDGPNCLINIVQDIGESESVVVISVFLTDKPMDEEFMTAVNQNGRAWQFSKDSRPHVSPTEMYKLNLVPDSVINRILKSWQEKANA